MELYTDGTCRICLARAAICNIFSSEGYHSGVEVTYRDMMTTLFTFSISPNDGMPSKICSSCALRLSSSYQLNNLAENSNKILSNYFAKRASFIKFERDENSKEIKKEIVDADFEKDYNNVDCKPKISNFNDEPLKEENDSFDCANDSDDDMPLICITTQIENNFASTDNSNVTTKNEKTVKRGRNFKKTKSTPSICDLCGKQVTHLKQHAKLHDVNRKRIKCTDCPRTFSTFGARKKHKAVHHLGLLYYCEICKKHYKRGYEHRRLIHSNLPKPFGCMMCDKKFHTEALLKFHITGHTKEKPFSCTVCGKAFRSRALSVYHRRRVHEGERKNICQYCSKGFFSTHHLTIHLRSHTKEKNYKCNECDKSFATNSALRNHERRHAGIKKEQCEHCHMAFVNKGALRTHMISHTKEKKHECKYCGVKFGRTDHRNRHEKTAHENKL